MQHLFDPLLAWADITTVAEETGLGRDVVERLYQHWIDVHPDDDTVGGDAMPGVPDLPVIQADIAVVAAETGLSHEVVAGIHVLLVCVHRKRPSLEDLLHYAAYGAEHLGEGGFCLYFGMPADPDHPAAPDALRLLEELAAKAEAWRNRRRPTTWTQGEFQLRYVEACPDTTPPFTPRSVAPFFVTLSGKKGIDPDHLRRLMRRFGVPRRLDWRTGGDRG